MAVQAVVKPTVSSPLTTWFPVYIMMSARSTPPIIRARRSFSCSLKSTGWPRVTSRLANMRYVCMPSYQVSNLLGWSLGLHVLGETVVVCGKLSPLCRPSVLGGSSHSLPLMFSFTRRQYRKAMFTPAASSSEGREREVATAGLSVKGMDTAFWRCIIQLSMCVRRWMSFYWLILIPLPICRLLVQPYRIGKMILVQYGFIHIPPWFHTSAVCIRKQSSWISGLFIFPVPVLVLLEKAPTSPVAALRSHL